PLARFGCAHKDVVLNHLAHLGLWVNWEKSKLFSRSRARFGQYDCMSFPRPYTVSAENSGPPEILTRWTWRQGTYHVNVTPLCHKTFSPWEDISLLRVQTHCCHNRCFQDRLGPPSAAMAYQLPGVVDSAFGPEEVSILDQGKHVLIRTVNTVTGASISHACHNWPAISLRATHILGNLNRVADSLSQQISLGGDRFDQAQNPLTASCDTPLGIDALGHSWPRDLHKLGYT
ncbi:hypothetical protein M9458_024245, partial [Cirrhinus mrigala]